MPRHPPRRLRRSHVLEGWEQLDIEWRRALLGLLKTAARLGIRVYTIGSPNPAYGAAWFNATRNHIMVCRRLHWKRFIIYLSHELGHALIDLSLGDSRYVDNKLIEHRPSRKHCLATLDEEFEAWWRASALLQQIAPRLFPCRQLTRIREECLTGYIRWCADHEALRQSRPSRGRANGRKRVSKSR